MLLPDVDPKNPLIPRYLRPGQRDDPEPEGTTRAAPPPDSPPAAAFLAESQQTPRPGGDGGGGRPQLQEPSPGSDRRTRTSSPGEARRPAGDAALFAQVLAGLLGVLALGAGGAGARRAGWVLRQPTDDQLDAIAKPLGRIANRHVPESVASPDLLDAVAAAAATRHYILDGALIAPIAVDHPGTEHNS